MTEILKEFLVYLRLHRKLWLMPVIVVILAVGGLLVLAEGSALAPFLYTVF